MWPAILSVLHWATQSHLGLGKLAELEVRIELACLFVNIAGLTNQDPEDGPPGWAATGGLDSGASQASTGAILGFTTSSRNIICTTEEPHCHRKTSATGPHVQTG